MRIGERRDACQVFSGNSLASCPELGEDLSHAHDIPDEYRVGEQAQTAYFVHNLLVVTGAKHPLIRKEEPILAEPLLILTVGRRPGHWVQQEYGWEPQLPAEMVHHAQWHGVVGGKKATVELQREVQAMVTPRQPWISTLSAESLFQGPIVLDRALFCVDCEVIFTGLASCPIRNGSSVWP
jgi:hypothetical protein